MAMKHAAEKILGGMFVLLLVLVAVVYLLYHFSSDFAPEWNAYVRAAPPQPAPESEVKGNVYLNEIQPIFDSRCVACHGCLNSPCLLKLTSFAHLQRGARDVNPDGTHLFPEAPVRLIDEPDVAAWRRRGFFPVIDPDASDDKRLADSNLYRMIMAGFAHNQRDFDLQPVQPIYKKENKHFCAGSDELAKWLNENPAAGMPFALPALNVTEIQTITDWIKSGAPGPSAAVEAARAQPSDPKVILAWEGFLNQDDPRAPIVARYIYEHTFLAHYHFARLPGEFYRMVRSATPPGEPVREIVTSRPFDDPFVDDSVQKVYYRFVRKTDVAVQKSFYLWEVNLETMVRLREIFFDGDWPADAELDPGYASHNPFEVFQGIPTRRRAQFLYENSKLIVSGMIQGPVCVGNLATYAIKDYFWAFLVKPESDPSVLDPELGLKSWKDFMGFGVKANADYSKAYADTLYQYKPDGYSVSDIWDGGKTNPNAWLTILRNETNATVLFGRKGGVPPTFWLVDFSGLERLYYSLVADYTYWGGTREKLRTWTFMGYLREEFEDNFLRLLPPEERKQYRDKWTQGIGQKLLFTMPFPDEDSPSAVELDDDNPMSHLLAKIQERLGPKVSGPADPLNPAQTSDTVELPKEITNKEQWEKAVAGLTMRTHQSFTPYLPSLTYLRIKAGEEDWVYTIVANRSYAFNNVVFDENGAAQPKLDTMSVYRGLVGDFPNLFVEVDLDKALPMLKGLTLVKDEDSWNAWKDTYATLRNNLSFWDAYDWFTQWNYANRAPEAGHYDLTYYMFLDSNY